MSKTYIVIYDVSEDGDSKALLEKLKTFDGWARITESSCAIGSDAKASEIRDEITKHIGSKGRLFVIKSGVEAAWRNTKGSNEWFKTYL